MQCIILVESSRLDLDLMTWQFVSLSISMDVSCLPCPLSILPYTILQIALKGIHITMFGEEIARIRKLGVQGVSYVRHSFR
jgi:hypothetical protein